VGGALFTEPARQGAIPQVVNAILGMALHVAHHLLDGVGTFAKAEKAARSEDKGLVSQLKGVV